MSALNTACPYPCLQTRENRPIARLLAETAPERPTTGLSHRVRARVRHTGTASPKADGATSEDEQNEGDKSEPETYYVDMIMLHYYCPFLG